MDGKPEPVRVLSRFQFDQEPFKTEFTRNKTEPN